MLDHAKSEPMAHDAGSAGGQHPGPQNPFCTRLIRPGALPYLFPGGLTAQKLVERLAAGGGWGQIVGPHGSGKTSLLESLVPQLQAAGRPAVRFALRDGQRSLPKGWQSDVRQHLQGATSPVVLVDGYEQLGLAARLWLRLYCRWHKLGLIVTSHQSVGLPELMRCEPSLELAQAIVERLQAAYPQYVTPADVQRCFAQHEGNLREMLFALYDVYDRAARG
jgi:hypothetical protein